MRVNKKFIQLQNSCYKPCHKLDKLHDTIIGVHFNLETMEAVATNGHHIVKIAISEEDKKDLALASSIVIKFNVRTKVKVDFYDFEKHSGSSIYYEIGNDKNTLELLDLPFPTIKDDSLKIDFFRFKGARFEVGISVAELQLIVASLPNDKSQIVTLSFDKSSNLAPIKVVSGGEIACLMPCRV